MTSVRLPRYAQDLRIGDLLAGCPQGCQCTGDGHLVQHLLIEHADHTTRRGPGRARWRVVVESCVPAYPPREFTFGDVVHVLVDPARVTPLRGHAARITASEPRSRGWYRWYDRHDVACSCGWQHPEPVTAGVGTARYLWENHRADTITALLAPAPGQSLWSSRAVLVEIPEIERRSAYTWRLVYRATRTATPPAPAGGEDRG